MKNFANSNFSFVKKFKIFGIISLLLACVGAGSFIASFFGITVFNYDIDFAGGVSSTYDLHINVDASVTDNISKIVNDVTGTNASSVQASGNENTRVIVKTLELDSEMRDALLSAIQAEYPAATAEESGFISASVSNDLKEAAVKACLLAIALILVYITIRFEIRSGIAAVLTLCHDICIMMAFFAIFQLPVNINFIAAALTILGYSINATIVVFDRIRENAKGVEDDHEIFAEIADSSIKQTLARSINTSITTLLPVILILILGVPSIQNFAIALLVGIISGTYSSVFLAGPLWALLRRLIKKVEYEDEEEGEGYVFNPKDFR